MATLDGMKVAILTAEGFEQSELLEPRKALQQAGAEALVVSPAKDQVQGWKHFDKGEFVDRVFTEDTPFTPMPEKATRVAIDEQVLRAALDGIRSVVIRPSLIYGRGIGVNSSSVQIPKLIEQAKKTGVARHIGRGLNVWSHVHITDVVDLYLLALQRAPAGSLFYVENGEASMKTAVEAISRMLGLGGSTAEWPIEEAVEFLGPGAHLTFGSNSRVKADKARKVLGWEPKGPSLLHEIEHGTYKEIYGP